MVRPKKRILKNRKNVGAANHKKKRIEEILQDEGSKPVVDGRRIVAVKCWIDSLNWASIHGSSCKNSQFVFTEENIVGLRSMLQVKCVQCGEGTWISTDSTMSNLTLPVNEALVWGTNAGGSHFQASRELLTVLEIPFPAFNTYSKVQTKVIAEWEGALMKQISDNGKEELELAKLAGDTEEINGIVYPCTSVFADGGWSTRSYGHSFKSKGGVAVLVGAKSKKLLYIGIKNMFCVVCKRAGDKNMIPAKHVCYKNWPESLSVTQMESQIVLEGFRDSLLTHGLIYNTLIADGDSSVYNSLVEANIYPGVEIRKAECVNHIIKNFKKFLINLGKDTNLSKGDRKLFKPKTDSLTGSLRASVKYRSKNDPTRHHLLRQDIVNIPHHVFGNHSRCASYFCNKTAKGNNEVLLLEKSALWGLLMQRMNRIAAMSSRLIPNLTTNICESIMSRVAKFNHGKRLNVIQRGGWKLRAISAALSFNQGPSFYTDTFKRLHGQSPSRIWKKASASTLKRLQRSSKYRLNRVTKIAVRKSKCAQPDKDYGPSSQEPDDDEATLKANVEQFMKSLQVTLDQQLEIFNSTVLQSLSPRWEQERQKRITASNAGDLFGLKDTTNSSVLVKKLLYPPKLDHIASVRYGRANERQAILSYEQYCNVKVEPSGLIVSLENGVLAATPDGLVGDDGIVEVKCPKTMEGYPPIEMPRIMGRSSYLQPSKVSGGTPELKKSHKYYRQIIMQLHISKRKWCDFVVFSTGGNANKPVSFDPFIQRIFRTDETQKLWDEMESKFIRFYREDLCPEIVNSRLARNMQIRQSSYRMEAIEAKKKMK